MENINLIIKNGNTLVVPKGTPLKEVVKLCGFNGKLSCIMLKIDDKYTEINGALESGGVIEPVYINDRRGLKTYERTLQYILIKAVYDLFPKAKVTMEHSLGNGIFGEIHKQEALDSEDILKIKERMQQIVNQNITINKIYVSREKAIEVFTDYNMEDKVRLLKHMDIDRLKLYELDGRYDYFYGPMAPSTGIINLFDLVYYEPGFLLRLPSEKSPLEIAEFVEQKKLSRIFYETETWGNILGVADVGSLNDKVENKDIINIIRVAEALHEKKIANIADMISDRKETKLVLIAGPSSSGKTTFSKRLGIQLRVNGLMPVPISLDDYFVGREFTPKDENGEYDFESIYALDLELFNKDLNDLMKGKEVEIPSFNFKTGEREWTGHRLKLPDNGIIVVEGIHGLNDMLTSTVPRENKFKIYISALTQLNLDDHNRISTTDVRIIRRIVRDFLSRGYGGEQTLNMWPSIRRGEEKNIFVFQEQADAMFNSTLVYELCVLKRFAIEELKKIKNDSPVYYEATKLISFLSFFKDVDTELVPENSLLREFIGGSCFYKY
ncbi:nucleoside kinase [Clostridium sp. 19966]|uniref:nucleoside kinase n=1 Tax=Clostridium sp. 19966 TaxID=2768166 RepID=UPI0028DE4A3C|nr:nucleoside kinase [Clostridium sp. 19966]MDT8718525.1 nucleoside kinase [Clostridium sp. 19966]